MWTEEEKILTSNVSYGAKITALLIHTHHYSVSDLSKVMNITSRQIRRFMHQLRKAGFLPDGRTQNVLPAFFGAKSAKNETIVKNQQTSEEDTKRPLEDTKRPLEDTKRPLEDTKRPLEDTKRPLSPVPKKCKKLEPIVQKTPVPKKPKNITVLSTPVVLPTTTTVIPETTFLAPSSSLVPQLPSSTPFRSTLVLRNIVRNIDRKTPEGSLENCIPNSYNNTTNHNTTDTLSRDLSININNINSKSLRAIFSGSTSTEKNLQQIEADRVTELMRKELDKVLESKSYQQDRNNSEDQLEETPPSADSAKFCRISPNIPSDPKFSIVETEEFGLVEMDLSGYESPETDYVDPETVRRRRETERLKSFYEGQEVYIEPELQKALDEIAAFQYVPRDPNAPPLPKPKPVKFDYPRMQKLKKMPDHVREKFLREVREEREKSKAEKARLEREWLEFESGKLPN